jgi:hypothetical protein
MIDRIADRSPRILHTASPILVTSRCRHKVHITDRMCPSPDSKQNQYYRTKEECQFYTKDFPIPFIYQICLANALHEDLLIKPISRPSLD